MKSVSWYYFVLPIIHLLVAGCSSVPLPAPSSGATNGGNADLDPKVVFSDLRELDYSPNLGVYQISTGDVLDVQVFKAPEFSRQETVNPEGILTLPLIGDIQAQGLTIPQLEQRITAKLREKYLQDPKVTIASRARGSKFITLEGAFLGPGTHALKDTPMNVLQAMALGSGLSDLADTDRVVLFRKNNDNVHAYRLDVKAMQNGQLKAPYVKEGDMIIAHRSDTRYWLREVATSMGNISTILTTVSTYNTMVK